MSSLIAQYHDLFTKIEEINDQINQAKQRMDEIQTERTADTTVRIETLRQQLEKIDAYLLRIRAFQLLAEKNLESQNVLSIQVPPNYRVSLTRLQEWSMMIDPTASNDPYAQRVYEVATCDAFFLNQKKDEFTALIAQLEQEVALEQAQEADFAQEIQELTEQIAQLEAQLDEIVDQDEMRAFAAEVMARIGKELS